jgi:hypothetical protein
MRTVAAITLRITGCLAFIPLAALAMIFTDLPCMIWAGLLVIARGADEPRTDRILLNRVSNWVNEQPLTLFTLASKIQGQGRCRCCNASVLVPRFGHETSCLRRRRQS